jgi:hypothetical protein
MRRLERYRFTQKDLGQHRPALPTRPRTRTRKGSTPTSSHVRRKVYSVHYHKSNSHKVGREEPETIDGIDATDTQRPELVALVHLVYYVSNRFTTLGNTDLPDEAC